MLTNKALKIAYWEFSEKIKSKAFIISIIVMPIIMITLVLVPSFFITKTETVPTMIGVIDQSGKISEPLRKKLDEKYKLSNDLPNYVIRNIPINGKNNIEEIKSDANLEVLNGNIAGYIVIPKNYSDSLTFEYFSKNIANSRFENRMARAIEEVIAESILLSYGVDISIIKKINRQVKINSSKIDKNGKEKSSIFKEIVNSGTITIFMLMFLILTSGQLLIRSVVEEKSNRIVEILTSSCSAQDIMAGKILGLSGLGIAQMFIWVFIVFIVTLKTGTLSFSITNIALSAVYFVLGYIFYSAIFVTAGSSVTTEQEAQHITTYTSLFLLMPILISVLIIQNPESLWIKILSFVPLLTPSLMVVRIPIQMPATWEIISTIIILIISCLVMIFVASKIFRFAILIYGKHPSLSEMLKWIRK